MKKEYDYYFKAAALLFIKHQSVGIALIQRKFRLGYNRAVRIFAELADEGIIKPSRSMRIPHELLIKDETVLNELLDGKELGKQILESPIWDNNL